MWSKVFLISLFLVSVNGPAAADSAESRPADQVPGIQEAPPGGDFTLQSADGPVSLQDFRGRLVFLFFGYTKCPDVCPTSLTYLVQALNRLSESELAQVQPIFISVDPRRDTPEILKEYANYFHEGMLGLTGSAAEVADVAALYGARYYEVELEGSLFGYAVNHSAVTYLITQEGSLRFIFPHQTPPQVLTDAVRYLLGVH
jgi:protein SCO1/2